MIESAVIEYLIEGKHIERSCTKEINDSSMKGRMQNWKKRNITNEQEQKPSKTAQIATVQKCTKAMVEEKRAKMHGFTQCKKWE